MPSTNHLIQLGRRLRDGIDPADGAEFDAYRASFEPALAEIAARCRPLVPDANETARLKTLESTRAKLARQQIRLPRIQDIAGLRLVVEHRFDQEQALAALVREFPAAKIDDYRTNSQNGYRAVHIIVRSRSGHFVEIQLRTQLENVWANICEEVSVSIDPRLKYGAGPDDVQTDLASLSEAMHSLDEAVLENELTIRDLGRRADQLSTLDRSSRIIGEAEIAERLKTAEANVRRARRLLAKAISLLHQFMSKHVQ